LADGVKVWVAGTLEFGMVGVLTNLVDPLAAAEISAFVVSTFDTDLLMVKQEVFEKAVTAIEQAGYEIGTPCP
jgi:uncharacterized protein